MIRLLRGPALSGIVSRGAQGTALVSEDTGPALSFTRPGAVRDGGMGDDEE